MKNVSMILTLVLSTMLVACSGGGGGGGGGGNPTPTGVLGCTDIAADNYDALATVDNGSCSYGGLVYGCMDNAANNYNALATVDNGSCTYGGGGGTLVANASYYGYNLSTTAEVTDRASTSLDASAVKVPNTLSIDTNSTKVATSDVDALVYQPSCLGSASPSREFRLVMLSGGSSVASTMMKLKLDANGDARITPVTDNSVSVWNFIFDLASNVDTTWTCNLGKYTLATGAEIYANGSVAVLKSGSAVYLGMTGSTLADNTSIGLSHVVSYQKNGGYNWSTGGTFGADSGEVYTNSQGSPNGGPSNDLTEIDFGTYLSNKAVKNDNGANGFVGASQGGSRIFYGVLGTVGGKKVGVFSGSHDPAYPTGSDSYSIVVEQ